MYSIRVLLLTFCVPFLVHSDEGPNFTSGLPGEECVTSADCAIDNLCINLRCEDPCRNACGANTTCTLVNTTPLCSCRTGFTGHPFTGCHPGPGVECLMDDECQDKESCKNKICVDACDNICGANSICKAIKHSPVCSCSPGYAWNPFSGCVSEKKKECTTDSDCVSERACKDNICVDPCESVCGNNALCKVTNHLAACACKSGFTGNALEGCTTSNSTSTECGLNNPEIQRASNILMKKKFEVRKEKVSWFAAIEHCRSMNMDLASITIPLEQSEIGKAINASGLPGYMWVAGSDWSKNGDYIWASTGHRFVYTNWAIGEPEVSSMYRCINLRGSDYAWKTGTCYGALNYVCEYYQM